MDYNFKEELKHIGYKIRAIRLKNNLTQISLASSCDVDIRTIQRIEKGTLNMSLKILFSLCNTLEINPSDLINYKEKPLKTKKSVDLAK